MSGAAAALEALEARLEAEAVDIAVAVATKQAGALIEREPLTEIRRLVADCFANLRGVPYDLFFGWRAALSKAALAAHRGGPRGFPGGPGPPPVPVRAQRR